MCQPTLDPVEPWLAINMTCPGELQFDTNLNVCNYAEVVGCVDKDTAIKVARSFEPEESSTGNPISELCQETEDGLAYFLADPENCSQYYMCQPTLDLDAPWIAINMTDVTPCIQGGLRRVRQSNLEILTNPDGHT